MASRDLTAVAERLFLDFMAPLVLGGAVAPGRPIGARAALALGAGRDPADTERLAHVQLARVRCARRLVAVDRFAGPSAAEWALAATLHDLIQSAHPGLRGPLRRGAPAKLATLAEATLERVAPAATVADALSRHTWFARALAITRTDTVVSWWVGKSVFLGEPAPSRLTAWPELRRVHVATTPRALTELPASGGAIDAGRFTRALGRWLERTPLTDLATCARATPEFSWSGGTLALVATRVGRTLAARAAAIAAGEARDGDVAVDRALGRATRHLLVTRAWAALAPALELLRERALADAQTGGAHPEPLGRDAGTDVAFARGAGALVARRWIDGPDAALSETERRRLASALDAARASTRSVDALLAPLLPSPT